MLKKVSFKTDPAFQEFFNGRDDPVLIRLSFLQNCPTEETIVKKLYNGRVPTVPLRFSFLHNFPTEGRMLKKVSFKTDPAFQEFFNGRDDPVLIRLSFLQNCPTEETIVKKFYNGRVPTVPLRGSAPGPPRGHLGTLKTSTRTL